MVAAKLIERGVGTSEAAAPLEVMPEAASQGKGLWNKFGQEGLRSKPHPGEFIWSHTRHGDLANFIPEDVDHLEDQLSGSREDTIHQVLIAASEHAGLFLLPCWSIAAQVRN